MPFTASHAVVALPFVRTPLVPAAIAIGAMTPDLPLFLRATPVTYQATHTNLVLSTAIALGLLLVWWLLLRPAVRELAPDAVARRIPPEWDRLPSVLHLRVRDAGLRALLVIVSLLLGVITHIVWDAFTHESRWGTLLVPALAQEWGPLPGYKWLQHASSLVGIGILAVYAVVWLARRVPAASVERVLPGWMRWTWWLSLPAALAAAWLVGLAVHGPLTATWTAQHLAYAVLPPVCGGWGIVTLLLCLAVIIGRIRSGR
ncbi:DUF4184 family protein [Microbacterium sp.]|uniref:DUF4184 family protein n=1 Tax=Microbacterium sp. TaxID=51671 RepID=UPI0039E3B3FA